MYLPEVHNWKVFEEEWGRGMWTALVDSLPDPTEEWNLPGDSTKCVLLVLIFAYCIIVLPNKYSIYYQMRNHALYINMLLF